MRIRQVEYYYTMVRDVPGQAYLTLSKLATADVNLLAFSVVGMGPEYTQLVLFPENVEQLIKTAKESELELIGPQHAFLVQGDDRCGALVELHQKLFNANINVYASSGVADGRGGYGYVVYIKSEDHEAAANVLGV